ncbi:expansin A23 [Perilla frutescens var. frutescens]|nr:expansin A23 [Perilla frutescens var. frutescens]
MGSSHGVVLFCLAILCAAAVDATGIEDIILQRHGWEHAHATFYGTPDGLGMGGACGYRNPFEKGYGQETTALSTALFNDGAACGACFEIVCINNPQWCWPGVIRVTATNFCPPDYSKSQDIWCNPPQKHFDLSLSMFLRIAEYKAGIVPVLYRRAKCWKRGGVKFEMGGNMYWTLVLVHNVGGAGDVVSVRVKSSSSSWTQMIRNWGQNWQTFEDLHGRSLSFEVTTSDGLMMQEIDVVPNDWQIGMSYEGRRNFG